jgi:hypothetical protein
MVNLPNFGSLAHRCSSWLSVLRTIVLFRQLCLDKFAVYLLLKYQRDTSVNQALDPVNMQQTLLGMYTNFQLPTKLGTICGRLRLA